MNNSDTKPGDDDTVDYDNYPKLEILPELPDLVGATTEEGENKGGGRRRRSKSKKRKTVKRKKTRRHRRK